MFRFVLIFTALFFSSFKFYSQEVTQESKNEFSRHAVGFMVGYAWVPAVFNQELLSETLVIPTLGFEYSFFISEKVGIGLVNDLEFSTYYVQDEEGDFIERENKYISALTLIYEPTDWLAFFTGPGYEFERHRGFYIVKFGAAYSMRLNDGWSWGVNVSVDYNDVYQTYSGGLMIGKRIP